MGLALLALYCTMALLFTEEGRDVDSGSRLLSWTGAIGGARSVWLLLRRKPIGRLAGSGVYLLGAVYYFAGALVSVLPLLGLLAHPSSL